MSLITRFVIVITIVVSIVDVAGFYIIKKYPERLAVPFCYSNDYWHNNTDSD